MAVVRSKYQLCTFVLRLRKASSARGLTVMGDMPGGALMAFCEPLKQMSTRSRSTCSGTAASEATVSTTSSAPSSSATLRNGSICVSTPEEVSPWASPTILIFLPLPARRTSSASTALPYGASTLVTFAGVWDAITAMRSEKSPFTQMMASSPASKLFTTEASIPPEPEAESGIVSRFSVWKIWRSSTCVSSMQPLNHGSRWPTKGVASARYTRGSMDEGPGVSMSRLGGLSSPMCCVMNCVLVLYVISVTQGALARAGESQEPSSAKAAKDRIPAESNFCSSADTAQPTIWIYKERT